jgi:hypothetical protein
LKLVGMTGFEPACAFGKHAEGTKNLYGAWHRGDF